jgi:hypothetical protein
VGDGLALNLAGGSGANNQSSTDEVEPLGPAWPAFYYDDGSPAGIAGLRVNTGAYKVAFLAFGFEGIDSESDRINVMQRTLDWLEGSSVVTQLSLGSGWNLSSWAVEPLMPDVEGALRTIEGRCCRVVGETGVYDCTLDPVFNTLQELHAGQAYYLHVSDGSSAGLWVEGTAVPPSTPIPLHKYWNWAGYLPAAHMPVTTALQSIESKYLMVHSIDRTYNPAEPLYSTLTHMEPGQGYLIRATEAVDLVYPASTASTLEVGDDQPNIGDCDAVSPSPYFAVVYGELAIDTEPAPEGTIVRVLDPSGRVAGCSVVRNAGHYGYMHVYGTVDQATTGAGFREGDPITFRVNGLMVPGPGELRWANDPMPLKVNLEVARKPAYLPLIWRSD